MLVKDWFEDGRKEVELNAENLSCDVIVNPGTAIMVLSVFTQGTRHSAS
jgi:hypothetical protein